MNEGDRSAFPRAGQQAARILPHPIRMGLEAAERFDNGLLCTVLGHLAMAYARKVDMAFGPRRAVPPVATASRPAWRFDPPRHSTALIRVLFAFAAALTDFGAIMATSIATGFFYHLVVYDGFVPLEACLQVGFVVGLLVLMPNIARDDYQLGKYLTFRGHAGHLFMHWNIAFLSALALGFMTKTSAMFSRATVFAFYLLGFAVIALTRLVLVRLVRAGSISGTVSARRIFLVGLEEDVQAFSTRYRPWEMGVQIAGAVVLRDAREHLHDDLALAAAAARMLRPDDVFILAPWSHQSLIDAAVEAFLRVPAAIHLGPERVLDRFGDAHISRMGPVASLNLVRKPLTMVEIIQKRLMDIGLASFGLILLAPLFVLIAVAIKLESRGPVFFLQRRYGFNQEPFRICKFRSMSVMEDGGAFRQATDGDGRVTRVGRWLRRFNLDELPQLLNVLRGDMSLVGPRPHVLAHDQQFDAKIALYTRRHNVRPGITGWAQVNGFRGDTSSDDKMHNRVRCDLYYIDNWSIWLDLRILFLTVFSRKAYRNAF
jgi:Undecaprenyl-phosphate glucose phosphotransferase